MLALIVTAIFSLFDSAQAVTWEDCAQEHNKAREVCNQSIQDAGAGIGSGQTGTKAATRDMSSRLAQKHKQAADRCRAAAKKCDKKCDQAASTHKAKKETTQEQNAKNIKNGSCKHEHSKADDLQKQADGYQQHAQGTEGSRKDAEKQKMAENGDGQGKEQGGKEQGGQQGGGPPPPPGGEKPKEEPKEPTQLAEQKKCDPEKGLRLNTTTNQCEPINQIVRDDTAAKRVNPGGNTLPTGLAPDAAESAGSVAVPVGATPAEFLKNRGHANLQAPSGFDGQDKKDLVKAVLHPMNTEEPPMPLHDHADFITELINAESFCAADKEIRKLEAGDVQAQEAAKSLRSLLAEKLGAAEQPTDEFGLELTCNQ